MANNNLEERVRELEKWQTKRQAELDTEAKISVENRKNALLIISVVSGVFTVLVSAIYWVGQFVANHYEGIKTLFLEKQ